MTRIDSWLWGVRVSRTRSAATALVRAGHVRVNGERVKAAQRVSIGDEVRVRSEPIGERTLIVQQLLDKRVAASIAALAYADLTPPPPPKTERVVIAARERGAGRPTKRDRREIDKLTGRHPSELES
ncbi:MAG TPA: S4 domain-containing protein [Pseudolysinimonas sp.]|nr:S4 domain-containing protein [Pseudolysinimonas sp.]